jgi:hypothetical protein
LNRVPEFLEIGVEPGVKAFLAQKPPVAFNQIELWRVGWQKEELYSQVGGKALYKGTLLVSGIIQDDGDGL